MIELDELLTKAVKDGASDLHLTVGCSPALRINGRLGFLNDLPVLKPEDTVRYTRQLLRDDQQERFLDQLDLDLPHVIPGLSHFRINIYHQKGHQGIAIRVIPGKVPSLQELEMPGVLRELALKQRGLVIVTGPTGVGKSTTLAAMIREINRVRSAHIVTIEDPIEYVHEHGQCMINQREKGRDVRSFPAGLRSALREDPDVIMVGEMRDLETMDTALTASETGHLVLASLHTRDAASTVDRIIDQFPAHQQQQVRTVLSIALEGVISQQLLVRRSGKGRVAAIEVMVASPAVRNIIREGKTHLIPTQIQTGGRLGMQSMEQSLKELCRRGVISEDEAMKYAFSPEDLAKTL